MKREFPETEINLVRGQHEEQYRTVAGMATIIDEILSDKERKSFTVSRELLSSLQDFLIMMKGQINMTNKVTMIALKALCDYHKAAIKADIIKIDEGIERYSKSLEKLREEIDEYEDDPDNWWKNEEKEEDDE